MTICWGTACSGGVDSGNAGASCGRDPPAFAKKARLMVHFTLPRNSKVESGKTWNRPEGGGDWKEKYEGAGDPRRAQ